MKEMLPNILKLQMHIEKESQENRASHRCNCMKRIIVLEPKIGTAYLKICTESDCIHLRGGMVFQKI